MTAALRFDPIRLPPECEKLRKEVRAFLADEIAAGTFDPHKPNREDTDAPEFSRRVGARGWLGMTWPRKYGGHERSLLERYVLTQFLVDMKTPCIKVNPIGQITGQFEFNEVVFTDAFMPDDHVLGEIDGAWKQATSELAYERSGPERFLETYYVLTELVRAVGSKPDTRSAEGIGRLVAQLHTMRRMSVSVAGMLQAGKEPVVEASIVKDIGTVWEQQLPHRVRDLAAFVEEDASNRETLEQQLSFAIKTAPKLTIQGGTTEVLRGIIARGLGLR